MNTLSLSRYVIALSLSMISAAGHAAFSAGNAIEVTYLFPNTSTVYASPTNVTGPSDTLPQFAGVVSIAFTDTSISMTIAGSTAQNHVAFDGVRFIDVNGTLNFDTLTLDLSASNDALFDPSRITHSPNTVFVNFVDLPDLASPQRVIVLTANPVPLPGALWLLGSALGGLGLARRRAV